MKLKTLIEENLNESSDVDVIVDKAIKDLQAITFEKNPIIDAFLLFADSYSNNAEAIKELKKLGSFEFQNSRDDKWDSEGYEDELYKDVTWGDLADLTLKEVNEYQKKKKSNLSLDKIEKMKKLLNSFR